MKRCPNCKKEFESDTEYCSKNCAMGMTYCECNREAYKAGQESMLLEEKPLKTGEDMELPDKCYCDTYEECTLCWVNRPIEGYNQAVQELKDKLTT